MSVFLLCEQAIGLIRGKRLILSSQERELLEALNYEGLTAAHAQDEACVCALHFEQVRDRLLELYSWIFARMTETPALISESVPGWKYTFQLPSDCLKVLAVIAHDKRLCESNPPVSKLTSPLSGGTREFFEIFYSDYQENVELTEYETAGGQLYANREVVYIRYTGRITDISKWTPVFKDAFIIKLAAEIAMAVSGDLNIVNALNQKLQIVIQEAIALGAIAVDTKLPKQGEPRFSTMREMPYLDYSGIPTRPCSPLDSCYSCNSCNRRKCYA